MRFSSLSRQAKSEFASWRTARARAHGTPEVPEEAGHNDPTAVSVIMAAPGVMELHLTGGPRRNVLARSTLERIERLVESAPAEVRVVLLTADAPDFCAGYDLFEAAQSGPEQLIAHEANLATLRRSSRPIVAALHGNVIGGGLELALAADIRLAARDTRLALPACALGLVYSEAGTRLLVDELGESTARQMVLGGRTISAEEALGAGIVMEVTEPDALAERALATATRIASWSPVATMGNRRLLDVVAGRVEDDTAALRLASFVTGGALERNIERFLNRRAHAPEPETSTWRRSVAAVRRAADPWRDVLEREVHKVGVRVSTRRSVRAL